MKISSANLSTNFQRVIPVIVYNPQGIKYDNTTIKRTISDNAKAASHFLWGREYDSFKTSGCIDFIKYSKLNDGRKNSNIKFCIIRGKPYILTGENAKNKQTQEVTHNKKDRSCFKIYTKADNEGNIKLSGIGYNMRYKDHRENTIVINEIMQIE